MRYTFTFLGSVYDQLVAHLATGRGNEAAGYVFAGVSRTGGETRFIGREFRPVDPEHIISRSPVHLSIKSASYCPALQYSDETRQSFWLVHSHPAGYADFSPQDDLEEPKLFRTAYVRIENPGPHGSLIFPAGGPPIGRAWLSDETPQTLQRIRVIGQRFRFFDGAQNEAEPLPEFFDRQVRAFGEDVQRLLGRLHVAVVGAGGTGSAVSEQLIRLGVGVLSIYDPQKFEASNVNRVYGSGVSDKGTAKVTLLERLAAQVGLGTVIHAVRDSIYRREVAKGLREADIIFGCTDEDAARSILQQVAFRYGIPVLDMGVKIDSAQGALRSVAGRMTALYPGTSCLFCRGRIDAARVSHDLERFFNPQLARRREEEGYAPELTENNPAVIPFTTTVASGAIAELLHRLTGFMGAERTTTELIYRFDCNEIGRNSVPPKRDCWCASPTVLGRGDEKRFLGMNLP
jgi:molybdopterin/thiamine biosynthesis adenylyltransferase/proteasome lid subunit RPN8/RPN11